MDGAPSDRFVHVRKKWVRRDEILRPLSSQRLHLRRPDVVPRDPELRAMFARVTKGALSGDAGQPAKEDFKINGQYVNTPDKGRRRHSVFETRWPRTAIPMLTGN